MNYHFPIITNIKEILPIISNKSEFIVVKKEGYTIINYVVMSDETFPDVNDYNSAILRECRGLIFDNVFGDVLSRRYHKFFNVNERNENKFENIDFNQPHIILEKLDGSMVTPLFVAGHVRWATKMGITDTSMEAEYFIATNRQHHYEQFAEAAMDLGLTPIFEWCSRKNRIVIDFPEDQLILTGIRDNYNGSYIPYETLLSYGRLYNFPVVKAYSYDNKNILDIVRNMENAEGVVVRFDNGHMVKIKSDWYVRLHKIKELITEERDIVKVILLNQLDDLLPIMSTDDVERIKTFQDDLMLDLNIYVTELHHNFQKYFGVIDRKTFAVDHSKKYDSFARAIIFKLWDRDEKNIQHADILQMVIDVVVKNCNKSNNYENIKNTIIHAEYKGKV